MRPFLWIPGESFDKAALDRLRASFTTAMSVDRASLDRHELNKWLFELALGLQTYGYRKEWDDGFHHVLPALIARGQERYAFSFLCETVITVFLNLHWSGARELYPGFGDDVLATLGQTLMREELWTHGEPRPDELLGYRGNRAPFVHWSDAGMDLSAAMVFCLKYLPVEHISPWATSALAIATPAFRVRLLNWLWGAWPVLTCAAPRPMDLEAARPMIGWQDMHCLGPDGEDPAHFLPEAQRSAFCAVVRRHLTLDAILAWCDGLKAHEEIGAYAEAVGLAEGLFETLR